jgi:signal transduction histidine kinase/FixJ family two-component response regulator
VSKSLTRNAHILALSAALLLMAAIGLAAWFQFQSTRAAQSRIRHTYEVTRTVDDLGIALRDAERGQRGYLLTGEESYLVPYNEARDRITLLQGKLWRLTTDDSLQQDQIRALAPLVQRKMDELARTIQLFQDKGPEAALALVRTNVGEKLMQRIQAVLTAVIGEEDRLLAGRQQTADRAEADARALALGGAVLALALLALSMWLLARVRSRLALSEADQRLLAEQMRAAFDSLGQGIAVFGPDDRLARWNDRFTILLDLPRQTMRLGMPYEEIAAQAAGAANEPFLETAGQIRHGANGRSPDRPIRYERRRAADGRSFVMRRTAVPDGSFVLTVADITERVRAEAMARDAERLQAIGQLTGGIAHDFNNLLTIVLGNLEMAKLKLEKGSPILNRVERAIKGAQRGASLTQQLLAFARRQPLAPAPVYFSTMLPDLAKLLRRTLGEHIEVQVADAAGLWPAMADPVQVESAVLNLALNARDAMPGGGRLTIEAANKVLDAEYARQRAEVTPGEYVVLAMSDTGTGMPPEVLARAFEPFFTTKQPGQGTGLGLSMVHGFAKQSGGHVKICSAPGVGTTVRLYLPRAVISTVLPAPQRPGEPIDLPRGSATVLVVEDDPAVREVTVGILRDLGYRVLEAGAGTEALDVFCENGARTDLLLCDVVLPGGMKGNEVAHRLLEIRPDLRVLFMSGYTENAIVHQGRLDEGAHLLGKPFSREALARKVAEVLDLSITAPTRAENSNIMDLGLRERGGSA